MYSEPSKWTQYAYARDKDGLVTLSRDGSAVCWCLSAAINICYPNDNFMIRNKVRQYIGERQIHYWNDDPNTTFDSVVKLIKELNI